MARKLTIFLFSASVPWLSGQTVDFNRDVRPLLTKNCTTCHGGVKMAGEVSFLYREDVLGKGESGKPVAVPGNPAASEMIRRIKTSDPDDRMPPPDHHPQPLPQKDIDTLTRWIEQGAKWGDHWAYEKPVEPDVPDVKNHTWPKQRSDAFLLARLEAEGLSPSPEASLAEWLRRTSLDLTGLPPSTSDLAELEKTATADKEGAMAALVDRLLASPAYGERWASVWLDLARYADTTGFEKDPHRDIWPWRDWVIRAFNEDMGYDEFSIKQLAGDLLPESGPDDLLATAFHRNTQNNTEGGTDDEEWRMEAVIDRVNTTWTAWNGVTFGCVQCHAHPYDPIPHENYYQFAAFLNNSEDVDTNDEFPRTKIANNPDQQAESVRLEKAIRAKRTEMNRTARAVAEKTNSWKPFTATKTSAHPATGQVNQNEQGEFISSGTNPTNSHFRLEAAAEPFSLMKIRILPKNEDPAKWDEQGAVIGHLKVELVNAQGQPREIPMREVVADFLAGPWDPNEAIKGGAPGFGEYPMMKGPRTAWIAPKDPVIPGQDETLVVTIHHAASCNGGNQNTVLRRFTVELSNDPTLTHFLAAPERAAAWKEHQQLKHQYNAIKGRTIPTLVERDDDARRPTRLFIRGNRMTLDHLVEPAIPELFDRPENPKNRLDMAQWIVGSDNPLAARVLANRLWSELFGTGIVETLEDFGSSGALPYHPELLDHLALRLRDHHDWHLKPFLKEIVLSSAYRQSHKASPELLKKDPRNRLVARGPRQRLTAEMVRDQALKLSGLISAKMYGPPVYPPQPEGVWRTVYSGQQWKTSEGADRYRRGIYTYVRRTAGFPGFLTFDAPSRDLCSARRVPTNTPLQALVTLNDPAHIEFAQALAERMQQAASDTSSQLAWIYRELTLVDADKATMTTLENLYSKVVDELTATPEDSAKLAATPEQAAMVMVANTLLNSDLALNR